MSLSRAWVFAGGQFQCSDFDAGLVADTDIVVGVDHGIAHCLSAGLVPDVLMGDFDSVGERVLSDERLAGVQRLAYPSRKNHSDLELALQWLTTRPVDRVSLLGVSGGRTDHLLFNWLLPLQANWTFAIEFIDASVHAFVVSERHPLQASVFVGQTVSMLPLPEAYGVSTRGLEYGLNDAHLEPGSTLGLSNIASADTIRVSVHSGRVLVFRVKADNMSR